MSLAVIVVLSIFGFTALRANERQNRSDAVQGVERTASLAGALASSLIGLAQQELNVLARTPAFIDGDIATIQRSLDTVNPPSLAFTAGMAWLDASVTQRAAWTPEAAIPVDLSALAAVRRAATGTPAIEVLAPSGDERFRPIVFAVPTFGADFTPNGVLTGAVLLDPSSQEALERVFGTDTAIALDADGGVVLGSADTTQRELGVARAALRRVPPDGTGGAFEDVDRSVVGWSRISAADWLVVVERSHDDVFGPSRWQYERSLAALALLVVASVAGAAYAAIRLDRVHQREATGRLLFQTLVQQLPVGVAAVDRAGRVTLTNQRAVDALGARPAVGDAVPPALAVSLDAMSQGRISDAEVVDAGDDDGERALVVRAAPVEFGGHITGAAVIVEDVTDVRRRIERNEALGVATAGLAAAASPGEVADVVAASIGAFGAAAALVVLRDPDDPAQLLLASSKGFNPALTGGYEIMPVDAPTPIAEACRTGREVHVTADEAGDRYPDLVASFAQSHNDAWVALPLRSAGRVAGALGMAFRRREDLTDDVRAGLGGFAAQVSQALDRASRQDIEHDVALVLQRGLLQPADGDAPGVDVVTRYAPAEDHLEVGGDFFDVLRLQDGSVLLVIGDVVGHGIDAASAMGQLRSAARALATTTNSPARLLEQLDRFAGMVPPCRFATSALVAVDTSTRTVRYSLAGHPPPLFVTADGVTGRLDGALSRPLGILETARPEHTLELPPGPVVVCMYTDGLVERRGEVIDEGLARLEAAMARHAGASGDALADLLLSDMVGGQRQRDDVAILCARVD